MVSKFSCIEKCAESELPNKITPSELGTEGKRPGDWLSVLQLVPSLSSGTLWGATAPAAVAHTPQATAGLPSSKLTPQRSGAFELNRCVVFCGWVGLPWSVILSEDKEGD